MNFLKAFIFLFVFHPLFAASHHPQDFLQTLKNGKNQGKEIVNHFCVTCHASHPLIPLGAPRMHHPQDWKKRLLRGKEGLFKQTNQGLGAMPPRGGCFECTDEQLRAAIAYMLDSKK